MRKCVRRSPILRRVSSTVALTLATTFAFGFAQPAPASSVASIPSAAPDLDRCSHLQQLRLSTFGPAGEVVTTPKQPRLARKTLAKSHRPEDDRLVGVPAELADLVTNDGADVLAVAYAPTDNLHEARREPFQALLDADDNTGRFIPPTRSGDHDWMRAPLPANAFTQAQQDCLATAIYFEARGETLEGQAAVAQVILNRVRNPAYPDTICDVVYQNQDWFNRCQFSFACDGVKDRVTDRPAFGGRATSPWLSPAARYS